MKHQWRTITPIRTLASDNFPLFTRADRFNCWQVDPQFLDDFRINVTDSTSRYGPHRELLMSGHADLSYDENIQWKSEGFADGVRNRHATSRKSEDHCVAALL